MKLKIMIGSAVIIAGFILAAVNFMDSNVEYGSFAEAKQSHKKIQVKGEWIKERPSSFDMKNVQFSFYMKDDLGNIERIVFDGAKPNNFDIAPSIVAKGKYMDDHFHATEILTKCPSKYQGSPAQQSTAP